MTLVSDNSLQRFLNAVVNGPTNYSLSHHLNYGQKLVVVLGGAIAELVVMYAIVYGIFKFLQNIPALFSAVLRRLGVGEKDVPQTFFELTFPADISKSSFATEQLHILLRGMVRYYGFWDRFAATRSLTHLE